MNDNNYGMSKRVRAIFIEHGNISSKRIFELCQALGFEPTQVMINNARFSVHKTRIDPGRRAKEKFNAHPHPENPNLSSHKYN